MSPDTSVLRLGSFLLVAGMSVVFISLLLLMLAIKLIQRLGAPRAPAAPARSSEPEVSGVLMAAIATTLLLDAEQAEEEERLVLTLRALPRPYPNWWQSRIARAPWTPQVSLPPRADVFRAPETRGKES